MRDRGIAVEEERRWTAWPAQVVQTLGTTLFRPRAAFTRCPEPIPHGRVLRFLATLRFPLWIALVMVLGWQHWRFDEWGSTGTKAIHAVIDPSLGRALSVWLLFMVPIGMPLLYFLGGLLAHISIALTGGATRSIGASMRAAGYALGLPLLAVALVDFPLYLGMIDGVLLIGVLVGIGVCFLVLAGVALARTHQMSVLRGMLVAVPVAALLVAVTLFRGVLEVDTFPLLEAPPEAYFLP